MTTEPTLTTISQDGVIELRPNDAFVEVANGILDNAYLAICEALALPVAGQAENRSVIIAHFQRYGLREPICHEYTRADSLLSQLIGWSLEPTWPANAESLRAEIEKLVLKYQ